MVLEHLFPEDWLERKVRYAFLIAVVYTTVSLVAARMVFAANSGIVSIMFVSLLLLPYMRKLLRHDEVRELKRRSFHVFNVLRDNWEAIKVYGALFIGIYVTYMLYTFLLPQLGVPVDVLFREQLALDSLRGAATAGSFTSILLNNWWVLLVCFLMALLTGDGALFFVTWNASTWGAIFGYRAMLAGASDLFSPGFALLAIFLITLPHVLLEGGAYILAAIAGGVLSDALGSRRKIMGLFVVSFLGSLALFFVLAFVAGLLLEGGVEIVSFAILLLFLFLLSFSFSDPAHKRVFRYNYTLFLYAVAVFLIGVLVELVVLSSSDLLYQIYTAAFI